MNDICGAFGLDRDISSEREEVRKNGMSYIRTLIDMAKVVGFRTYPGRSIRRSARRDWQPPEKKPSNRLGVRNMQSLSKYAADWGVRLAIEPFNRSETDFLNTTEQALQFLAQVGADNVGLLMTRSIWISKEKDIPAAVRRTGDKLFSFHACANDWGTSVKDHLDCSGISLTLKDIGYDGAVVIESFTTGITEIARAVSPWRPLAES